MWSVGPLSGRTDGNPWEVEAVMSLFSWEVVHGGQTPPPGESVGPMQRLSWGRTVGLGAQHVVAMFEIGRAHV